MPVNNLVLYVLTVLIWGSTWFAIEFQLGTVPPEVSVAYRYLAAALILFGWCIARRLPLRFSLAQHRYFALLGLLLFGLNYILTYKAQIYIVSALSAIAFSSMLWMNIVLSRILFGTRVTPRVIIGSVLGVAGVAVLFAPQVQEFSFNDSTVLGSTLALLGALSASLGNMVSQASQRRELPVVQSNAWGMLYGALLTGGVAFVSGKPFVFDTSMAYIGSLAYLTVFGSIVAFGAYLTLLGRIGADKAGYAMVMFPVVAIVLSALFEGLRLDASTLIGFALVLCGNFSVSSGNFRQESSAKDAISGSTYQITLRK